MGFPDGSDLPAMQETGFNPWVRKILWRRKWQPTPVFLPGEFHGQRSFPVALVVKNPSANASDLRDVSLILGSGRFPGGGHGNPLQYSCLENPMDRGAWQSSP